jgi:hypothetical protein
MKKLIVVLAGFGSILLAGGVENSSAQNSQSVFPRYHLSDDSLRALLSKARPNSIYLKPIRADRRKVAGEFLVGAVGAAVLGYVGARAGWNLTYVEHEHKSKGLCDFDLNLSGLPGAIAGYLILSNLGCAAGVSLVGNTGGEKGSYWASFGGGVAGALAGGLCALGIAVASDYESAWAPAIVLVASQAGGATMAFNNSRKRKAEVSSGALLNLKGGRLSLAPPGLSVFQGSFSSNSCKVTLFEAKF